MTHNHGNQPRLPAPVAAHPTAESEFARLCEIMRILRSPEGCPWDLQQSWTTLAPYVLEEACEVIDAIDRHDAEGVREEIGDLIFEGIFLAQVASDEGHFAIRDCLRTVGDKLVRRHPHVFVQPDPSAGTDGTGVVTPAQVVNQWQEIKALERRAAGKDYSSALDGVAASLPSLPRAQALGARAAKMGFDWPSAEAVFDKIDEELLELKAEAGPERQHARAEELGDLLFAVVQYARKAGIDADAALRAANRKFTERFTALEDTVRNMSRNMTSFSLDELEAMWQAIKGTHRQNVTE